jgi:hypothetical protein
LHLGVRSIVLVDSEDVSIQRAWGHEQQATVVASRESESVLDYLCRRASHLAEHAGDVHPWSF